MNALVIDSSTNSVAIAVGQSSLQASSSVIAQQSKHSENILVSIKHCLDEQGLKPRDIEVIGLGVGPGLFTGLRVGITAAHSIAHSIGCSIVPFSSLELAALSSRHLGSSRHRESSRHPERSEGSQILIAKDARRHEVYWAHYQASSEVSEVMVDGIKLMSTLKRLHDESLISPGEFVEKVNATATEVYIDDLERYDEFSKMTNDKKSLVKKIELHPAIMIDAVIKGFELSIVADVFSPQALYLRKSDAELSWGVKS